MGGGARGSLGCIHLVGESVEMWSKTCVPFCVQLQLALVVGCCVGAGGEEWGLMFDFDSCSQLAMRLDGCLPDVGGGVRLLSRHAQGVTPVSNVDNGANMLCTIASTRHTPITHHLLYLLEYTLPGYISRMAWTAAFLLL